VGLLLVRRIHGVDRLPVCMIAKLLENRVILLFYQLFLRYKRIYIIMTELIGR